MHARHWRGPNNSDDTPLVDEDILHGKSLGGYSPCNVSRQREHQDISTLSATRSVREWLVLQYNFYERKAASDMLKLRSSVLDTKSGRH